MSYAIPRIRHAELGQFHPPNGRRTVDTPLLPPRVRYRWDIDTASVTLTLAATSGMTDIEVTLLLNDQLIVTLTGPTDLFPAGLGGGTWQAPITLPFPVIPEDRLVVRILATFNMNPADDVFTRVYIDGNNLPI